MERCLNEAAFVRIYTREGTAAERLHVRLCADCAERYDQLVEDLETIGAALEAPPVAEIRSVPWRVQWVPAAAACMALIALLLGIVWVRRPSPIQVAARAGNVNAFAADLSAALFASDANLVPELVAEAPYVEAALEVGEPCTRDRYLDGECNDHLSALLIEGD